MQASYAESHSAQIGYRPIHGAINGIRTGGFTKGRGTRDQISNLRWIMERSTEYQRPIYVCFIDYSKAFDCVDHPTLWNMMEEMGIPKHIVQVIGSLYANQEAKILTEYGDTESFSIGKGVRMDRSMPEVELTSRVYSALPSTFLVPVPIPIHNLAELVGESDP